MNDKTVVEQVEVNKKVECEKTLEEQLEIMERYTKTHEKFSGSDIYRRELECLKVLYPSLFRNIEEQDLVLGRVDALPVGFGSVTSIGGVGHYCIFSKLKALFDFELFSIFDEFFEDNSGLLKTKNQLKAKNSKNIIPEVGISNNTKSWTK